MKYITTILLMFTVLTTAAQLPDGVEDHGDVKFNHIKLNLTSIPFNNYSVQYERVLTKKSSVGLSFRIMPESKIPLSGTFKSMVAEGDAEIERTIDKLRISNFAITPEYRFYLGRGYGHGFYIAPFYRYARFRSNNVIITYDSDIIGTDETINLSGTLSSHTGGILFGAQWLLGKNISLDWMIAGPHFGAGNGSFIGVTSQTLSPGEQQRVRDELENLDIPFTKKTITTNPNGATLGLDGPWGGIRAGISLGVRF